MPFHQPTSVRFYTFDMYADASITHAVFTRLGGVSKGQWKSLNVGLTVGDDPENVFENRRISFSTANRPIETLSDSWLTHGTEVVVYDSPRPTDQKYPPKGDILLTDRPEVTLFMRFADCAPILLFDPVRMAIGLAHSGWLGSVKMVARRAVEAMQARYNSNPHDILAAIGPSIGPSKYVVGPEVIGEVEQAFGADASELLPRKNNSTCFDLWAANRLVLTQAGVKHIEIVGICTGENLEDWFSHRAEKGKTGRFGVLLGLDAK